MRPWLRCRIRSLRKPQGRKPSGGPNEVRGHTSGCSWAKQNPAGFVRYAVEILNTRERSAGLSNQVLIPVAPTIAPPEQLTAKVEADGVLLSWTGPAVPVAPPGLTYRYRVLTQPCGLQSLHRAG